MTRKISPNIMSREIIETRILNVLKILSIIFFLFMTLFPFYWMLNLSFRPFNDVLMNPTRMFPRLEDFRVTFAPLQCIGNISSETCQQALSKSGFTAVLFKFKFLTFIRNSALISSFTVLFSLLIAVPAAYAISRLQFRGREALSLSILIVYLFPAIVISIPLFVFFVRIQQTLGLNLRSPGGITIIYMASTLPLALYMLRGYFQTIPPDLEQAAMIDGTTRMGALWRVTLPLAAPAIASVALYVFMIAWNEYLFALLFLVDSPDAWTLPLGLTQQLDSQEVPRAFLMAGSVIITVPVVVLFFFFERFLTGGLTAGGVKG